MVATEKPQYKIIGTRPRRPDGVDKVTGRAQYGADIKLEGLLYGAILRSPHAHALIKSIDTSKAEALNGVHAVITNADLVGSGQTFQPTTAEAIESGTYWQALEPGKASPRWAAENLLAGPKALYHGHAIAAVAADDVHIAQDALELIDVEYELLPHVVDVQDAMVDGAPILHPQLRTGVRAAGVDTRSDIETNLASHMRLESGNIEEGFAAADLTIEREFTSSQFHQGYLEPQNATAFWSHDGRINIWTSTQGSFMARDATADVLGVPVASVKVTPMEIGGGFGGKIPIYLEPMAAVLSKKSSRPVKMWMDREAVFQATGPTASSYSKVKIGVTNDGKITAAECLFAMGAGGFPGSPVGAGVQCALAPYKIDNQVIDGLDVVLNTPKTAAYRAPGAPATEYAVESVMDEIAEQLDMDPIDLRLVNVAEEGVRNSSGTPWPKIGAKEVLEAMKSHPHYLSEIQGEDVGRGIAIGFWFNGGMESSSSARVNKDGSIALILGSVDIGGSRASISMQLAETLGVTYEQIAPQVTDTDSVGYTAVTGGSRTTFAGGWVAYELGQTIKAEMISRAAKIWDISGDEITYTDEGTVVGPDDAEGNKRVFSFNELAGKLQATGGLIAVSASSSHTTQGAAYGGHIVDLKVDRDTGKTEILRYTAVQDVGTAIHPDYVEGQIQGGIAQGVGMALNEEYYYDSDGHLMNGSFLDYRVPVANDLPMLDVEMVEVPNPGHPFGVRGVGEVPIVPPQPTIRNAVYDAIGVRFYHTPMSPRRVLDELL